MASLTSKQWRRVVLGCPLAWSHIHVSILPKQVVEENDPEWCIEEDYLEWLSSPRGKARPLDLWAERADASTLSLSVRAACTVPHIEVNIANTIRALHSHFHKFRHLHLVTDTAVFEDVLVTLFSGVTTTWESIQLALDRRLDRSSHIAGMMSDSHVEIPKLWASLRNSTKLRTLSFRRCLPILPEEHQGGASRLRSLSIVNVDCDYGRMLQILSHCPNLSTLHLSVCPPSASSATAQVAEPSADTHLSPVPLPATPIFFPSLSRLSMHQMDTESCQIILQHIKTPILSFFSLWNHGLSEIEGRIMAGEKTYDIMAPFGEAVVTFAAQASQLRTFHITNSALPDRHLLQVLGHMESLEELRLKRMNIGGLLFRGLSRATKPIASRPVLCRSLRRLSLFGCEFVTDDHLEDLIFARSARRSLTVPISFLEVDRCKNVTQEGMRDLKEEDPSLNCTIVRGQEDEVEVEVEVDES
ncbi:hypothetical protein EUX98_g8051 [Antrodiella citrinella]|uniref:F-box domain-containing protein n=1 Tax=Antrodiella citrinella TaxID=2447956 RepID=A0A4S4MDZ0_9APHY|nr:hypothetical protein EUX98_g8051 [Antrodiella citrinella]